MNNSIQTWSMVDILCKECHDAFISNKMKGSSESQRSMSPLINSDKDKKLKEYAKKVSRLLNSDRDTKLNNYAINVAELINKLTKEEVEDYRQRMNISKVEKEAQKLVDKVNIGDADKKLLYVILIYAAWEVALEYDSSKTPWDNFYDSKFLKTRWGWARNKFLKRSVSLKYFTSLSDPINDNQGVFLDVVADPSIEYPDAFHYKESQHHWNSKFAADPGLKVLVNVVLDNYGCLCVYCRRKLLQNFQQDTVIPQMLLSLQKTSIQNVYERRRLWVDTELISLDGFYPESDQ